MQGYVYIFSNHLIYHGYKVGRTVTVTVQVHHKVIALPTCFQSHCEFS
jgi:hypothetical protein